MASLGLPQPPRPSTRYHEFLPEKGSLAASFKTEPVVNASILCPLCRPIQLWLQENWDSLKIEWDDCVGSFDHCATGLELQRSSLGGCHLCTIIWYSFDPYDEECRGVERTDKIRRVLLGKDLKIKVLNVGDVFGPHLSASLITLTDEIIYGDSIPMKHSVSTTEHDISPTTVSTSCAATQRLSETWILECATSHNKCKQGKTSDLPGRILDVLPDGEIENVRIVDTLNLSTNIQYVTLSYCWGKGPRKRLTSSTLNEFLSGVPIQSLPKTIQDAIHFTRKIRLKWLWVDSLCIIQDSPADWNRESSKMRVVYQNSFLTLAALGASNSDEGLFALRDPLVYLPCELLKASAEEVICAFRSFPAREKKTRPLHRRRWAVQERILSPRTLNFDDHLTWRCREKSWDEYPIAQQRSHNAGDDLSRKFFDAVLDGNLHQRPRRETGNVKMDTWRQILAAYSDGALTFQSDSLKAISGIITAIQKCTGWRNLAGLWEPFLWSELLWERSKSNPGTPTGLNPTWSWISISGAIDYLPEHNPGKVISLRPICDVKLAERKELKSPSRDNLGDARMRLQVSCVPVKISPRVDLACDLSTVFIDLVDCPWVCYIWSSTDSDLRRRSVWYTPDSDPARNPERFLPLATATWKVSTQCAIVGIAVSPSLNCPGAFERVGYISTPAAGSYKNLLEGPFKTYFEPSKWESIFVV